MQQSEVEDHINSFSVILFNQEWGQFATGQKGKDKFLIKIFGNPGVCPTD